LSITEAWDRFTSADKELFQNCCRKLLRNTFLVRDKSEDLKHYFFVCNQLDIFYDYFSYMGFEVKCERDQGVVMLTSGSSNGEKGRLQSNRYRFSKEETILLCCLWLLYMSRLKEGSLSSIVTVQVADIRYELEKYNARDLIGKSSFDHLFRVFKNYSLLGIDGKLGDMDCKIILYPSIQFTLDVQEFEQFVKKVEETILMSKDEIEEESDEQSDDIESE